MRKLLILIITFFCPGIIFLLNDQQGKMLIAFALQVSIIGWIPAIIWARHSWLKKIKASTPKPRVKRATPVTPSTPALPEKESNTEKSV